MRGRCWGALTLALATAGCDEPTPPPQAASVAAPVPVPLVPSAAQIAQAEDETSTRPVELLAHQFTSGVKDRAPVDVLKVAKPGQRVHTHLTLRNRTGRKRTVHVTFRVGGEVRTELDLEVGEAWSWRTWGFNTILEKDRGKRLELEVVDDEGHPLVEAALPISG